MIIQKDLKGIHSILAVKYKLPRLVIELICNSPFRFIHELISSGDSKTFRLLYLGKFKLKNKYGKKDIESD